MSGRPFKEIFKIAFLSSEFYSDYPAEAYSEILRKKERPYAVLLAEVDGVRFAIPFRSTIRHNYCFLTNKEKRSGLDYTKAVVIQRDSYLDKSISPQIKRKEFAALKEARDKVENDFRRYLKRYKNAKFSNNQELYERLSKRSSLRYFEDEFIQDVPASS